VYKLFIYLFISYLLTYLQRSDHEWRIQDTFTAAGRAGMSMFRSCDRHKYPDNTTKMSSSSAGRLVQRRSGTCDHANISLITELLQQRFYDL